MKKYLAILLLLAAICVYPVYAWWSSAVVGQPAAAPAGCSKGATIFSEDFEAIANDEEWSNDGNWAEFGASTNVFVGDDAQLHGGSLSGLVLNTAGGMMICRTFTEVTSGFFSAEYWVRWQVMDVTQSLNFVISDGSITTAGERRVEFQVTATGDLQINDNASWQTIAAVSQSTWYKIEVQVNTSQTDGIDAVRVWLGNGVTQTEGTNSPYDTRGRTNPAGIDRLGYASDSSTNANYWIDDVLAYTGERCEN